MLGDARLLSKSKFTLACECPAKLYFAGKPAEFADTNLEDEFLSALADGGYQVEALAKCHFPSGTEIDSSDPIEALRQTEESLEEDGGVVYQAAFSHESLFVRADIVKRVGDTLLLYEVKAKGWDPTNDDPFFNKVAAKRGRVVLNAKYRKELLDVAFQTFVINKQFPRFRVVPHLVFANKRAPAQSDGINQRFVLHRQPNGRRVIFTKLDDADETLGRELLIAVPMADQVGKVLAKRDFALSPDFEGGSLGFEELALSLAAAHADDRRIGVSTGSQCKDCEFVADPDAKALGLKSGFDECWAEQLGRNPAGIPVLRLWNFRGTEKLLGQGKHFLEEVEEGDVNPSPDDQPGLSNSQRQWLQVQMIIDGTTAPYLDRQGLAHEMDGWTFPFHFIDFETSRSALPFHSGMRPYETIAFQFSHHVVHQDGRIEHRGQWINDKRGVFPNFDFVRHLKADLDGDEGTIFRYAAHENTTLLEIYHQLQSNPHLEVNDRDDLCRWIQSVTESRVEGAEWRGPRMMVDMCQLVKRYYLHPLQIGSNSLKAVLPAILTTSRHLQGKYSRQIYGVNCELPSLNFGDPPMAWVQWDGERVRDPYSLLPPIFTDYDQLTLARLSSESEIENGGAAMVAYARMQFTEMSETECQQIIAALLRYCELDTLAMVLLYEHWMELLGRLKTEQAA